MFGWLKAFTKPSTGFLESLLEKTADIPWPRTPRDQALDPRSTPENLPHWTQAQALIRQTWPDADRLALTWLLDHQGRQQAADKLSRGDRLLGLLALWVVTSPAPGAGDAIVKHLQDEAGSFESESMPIFLATLAARTGASRPYLAAVIRERVAGLLARTRTPQSNRDTEAQLAFEQSQKLTAFLDESPESVELIDQALHKFQPLLARGLGPAYNGAILRLAQGAQVSPRWYEALAEVRNWAGFDLFLAVCRHFARFPKEKPPMGASFEYMQSAHPLAWAVLALVRMAPPTEADRARAGELAALPPDTLLTAALFAPSWAPLIEPLLDWPGLAGMIRWLMASGEASHWAYCRWKPGAQQQQEEDEGGAIDRHVVLRLTKQMGEARLEKLLKHQVVKSKYKSALYLLRACLGENAADVEAGFVKRNKLAVRALGLLPDEGDTLQRYLALRKFAKESRQFGAQRQASETQAAEDGLANLAATAGYADLSQLEWAMEAQLAQEMDPTARRWTFGEYTLWLQADAKASVVTERNGKRLKDVPPAVRKDHGFVEIKEARELLQEQWERIRRRLEFAMARAEVMDRERFAPALTTPAGRALTADLVLRCWVEEDPLEILDGQTLDGTPVAADTIRQYQVAHPLHLAEAGTLTAWQRRLTALGREQPFNQLFREVYTRPDAATRIGGRQVRLGALVEKMKRFGWQRSYDYGIYRELGAGCTASVDFTDGVAVQEATEILTTRALLFEGTPDPISFSEAVRAADLSTFAAAADRAATAPSTEALAARAALVQALAPEAQIEGAVVRLPGGATFRLDPGSTQPHPDAAAIVARLLELFR